ncbi:hypothetical protein B5F76_05885 [Desulfovibrio sp. An276]|uniref:hypothetical protein n=1 Tax=Desulfovibrio sp. An276 TaxID=1965618 RepID=UPI000B3869B6|nr:hypothetical protein [Desulfovibrio sp. An276]OUO53307.1 hypothetical protein B5F76_05885 [Desulfovibrio sp. An276]
MASLTPWLLRSQDPLWRDDHDYKVGAIRTGSDGAMYTAIKENGPNTEAGVKDPTKSPDCWMSLKDSLSIDGPNYLKPEDIGAVSLEGDSVAPAATKLETERTLAGVAFDGTGDIIWYGACSTASGTAAKTVALEGFKLGTGAEVTVKFNNTVTSANPTLNVNNTGAKAIFYNGAAVASGVLRGNRFYRFVYDGTRWNLIGDADADVKQTAVTTNDQFPLLFTGTADATGTKVEGTQFGTKITANPSTGTITATKFDGAVEGNADTASKLATACNIDGVEFDGSASITHYGTCSTAAGTAAKTVALTNFVLEKGACVVVRFSNSNTATNATLNVNRTGAKAIRYKNAAIPAGMLEDEGTYEFTYDGSCWQLVGVATSTIDGSTLLNNNFNNLTTAGQYFVHSTKGTTTNAPMDVTADWWVTVSVYGSGTNRKILQEARMHSTTTSSATAGTSHLLSRGCSNTTWGPWQYPYTQFAG